MPMNIKSRNLLLVLILGIFVFQLFIEVSLVSAVNVGVSPASLSFKEVLRGGYAEGRLVVSVDSEEETLIKISSRGEISDWLSFEENFSVSRRLPHQTIVSVTPPSDMPNGNYSGFLTIEISTQGQGEEGHAVSVVRSVLDVYVTVEVTDKEIIRCDAGSYTARTAEQGDDIVFKVNVTNTGNVRLSPDMIIDIWDDAQLNIVKKVSIKGEEILPTTEETLTVRVDSNDLEISQYWADFSVVDCLSSSLLTFDVLEEGALKADGILLNILTIDEVGVGETVPIEVNFKNVGEKEVNSQFRGQITKSGRIVQVLESPYLTTEVEEVDKFNFFFTPKEPGQYLITGRVFYSSKRTFELSTAINVLSSPASKILLSIVYTLLIASAIFLFVRIRRERRKTLDLFRMVKLR